MIILHASRTIKRRAIEYDRGSDLSAMNDKVTKRNDPRRDRATPYIRTAISDAFVVFSGKDWAGSRFSRNHLGHAKVEIAPAKMRAGSKKIKSILYGRGRTTGMTEDIAVTTIVTWKCWFGSTQTRLQKTR